MASSRVEQYDRPHRGLFILSSIAKWSGSTIDISPGSCVLVRPSGSQEQPFPILMSLAILISWYEGFATSFRDLQGQIHDIHEAHPDQRPPESGLLIGLGTLNIEET